MKNFDLNINKILENWDIAHAIRELIANALDESLLTGTKPPKIFRDNNGWWRIRDYGRGLKYQDLIQNENPEKLNHPSVIGKFGIGLKDALATFERKKIRILIRSRHGNISLKRVSKHSFEDIITLHATVAEPSLPSMAGTECCLHGVSNEDIRMAANMFLPFSKNTKLEKTNFGSVYESKKSPAVIFINGLKVAEEPNFLFSYNITSLTAEIKKSLNRERQNLGRSAYSSRIKTILLNCSSPAVIHRLADDLQQHTLGNSHDELGWVDVQNHAVKTLNSQKKVVFLSSSDIINNPVLVDDAKEEGYDIIPVPENLAKKIEGAIDISGSPVVERSEFVKQQNDSFEFVWVTPEGLTDQERVIWNQKEAIMSYLGGCPEIVQHIKISETMNKDIRSGSDTVGLWEEKQRRIIIKRCQLKNLSLFAGTLLHEVIHAKYGVFDISREFEHHLTRIAGSLAEKILILQKNLTN